MYTEQPRLSRIPPPDMVRVAKVGSPKRSVAKCLSFEKRQQGLLCSLRRVHALNPETLNA